jgi:uncharacterized protein YaeQ
MALTSTMYVFTVNLSDTDRSIYATLEIRAAKHPSETEDFLLTRVLAYCLEYREGICFARGGVSDQEEPTLYARDLTGALTLWVEIGAPSAERLHQASKAAPRVAVYCHKNARQLDALKEAVIHKAERIDVFVLDPAFLQALVKCLERRMTLDLTVSDGHLYCAVGKVSMDSALQKVSVK